MAEGKPFIERWTRRRSYWRGVDHEEQGWQVSFSDSQGTVSGTEPLNLLPPCGRARHKQVCWMPYFHIVHLDKLWFWHWELPEDSGRTGTSLKPQASTGLPWHVGGRMGGGTDIFAHACALASCVDKMNVKRCWNCQSLAICSGCRLEWHI